MLPITSLPDKIQLIPGNKVGGCRIERTLRRKQAKPHNLPLDYSFVHCENVSIQLYGGKTLAQANCFDQSINSVAPWQYMACQTTGNNLTSWTNEAVNLARAKFVDALGERSEWLVNAAEFEQASGMIQRRGLQLYRMCKNVIDVFRPLRSGVKPSKSAVRRRIATLRGDLAVPPNRAIDWRRALSSPAGLWLELHFGWDPLVKDIHAAVVTLSKPHPSIYLTAKSQRVPINSDTGLISGTTRGTVVGSVRAKMGATVVVTNPNLFLASQLGLINPATVAWELVPFSFVLDWFGTVGQFLGQWTDFVGCSIEGPWYATRASITATYSTRENWFPYPGEKSVTQGVYFRRYTTLPGVTLGLKSRSFSGISLTRGATAISLLIQQGLKPMSRK